MNDTLHIVKPETSELTVTYVIERMVEYAEKNKRWPKVITTRPKNFVTICYYMNTTDLAKSPTILGIPLEVEFPPDEPESTRV